jgi:uncharacterized protein (TIGR03437 family)
MLFRPVVVLTCCFVIAGQASAYQLSTTSAGKSVFALVKKTITRAIVADNPCIQETAAETKFAPTDPFVWLAFSYSGAVAGEQGVIEWVQPSGEIYSSQPIQQRGGTPCVTSKIGIAGQPAAIAAGDWIVRVKWQGNAIFEEPFEIVRPKSSGVVVLSASVLPEATVGREYEFALSATGGSGKFTWSAGEGSLPPGLSLSPVGQVAGIPLASGSYRFEIAVDDGAGDKSFRTYALAVASPKLVLSPKSLTFTVAPNSQPVTQPVDVSSSGAPLAIEVRSSSSASFTVTPSSAMTPARLTIQVNPRNLRPGIRDESFSVVSAGSPATIAVRVIIQAQESNAALQPIIDTFAGNTWSFPRSGLGVNAPINDNLNLAIDIDGSLLIADKDNHVVLRLKSDGNYEIVAGTGLSGSSSDGQDANLAALNEPAGLAVDSVGNIYVAEANSRGGRIRRITPQGIIDTFAATGMPADPGAIVSLFTRASQLAALAVDSLDNVYVHLVNGKVVRRITPSGVVTTVAGNGENGVPVHEKAAAETPLGDIDGIAVSPKNDLYLSYGNEGRIRRVRNGIILNYAGFGRIDNQEVPAIEAGLLNPRGIAFSKSGDLYVVESSRDRIRLINSADRIMPFAGGRTGNFGDGGPAIDAYLRTPTSVAVDAAGQVFFGDAGNLRVRRVDTAKIISTIVGNGSFRHSGEGTLADLAYLFGPRGLAIDPEGNVFVAEALNHRVTMIAGTGATKAIAGTGAPGSDGDTNPAERARLKSPTALAYQRGSLYIVDQDNGAIRQIDGRGFIQRVASGLKKPAGIAFDPEGNLYVAEAEGHRIVKVANGVASPVAGDGKEGSQGDGGSAINAGLNSPSALVFSDGYLYIADSGNNKVRRFALPSGKMELVAGTGRAASSGDGKPAILADINSPSGLFIDKNKNIYIAETNANKVRRIGPDGVITTVAGTGTSGYEGDGGAATSATLSRPTAVVVDEARGRLLIADSRNHAIRTVSQVATAPTVTASAASLSFAEVENRLSTTIELTSSQRLIPFSVSVSTRTGGNWLRATPENGTVRGVIDVSVSGDELDGGTYEGTIVITTRNANAPRPIPVTFKVLPKQPPRLLLQSKTSTLSVNEGSAPATLELVVSNTSNKPLTVAASVSGAPWASISADPMPATLADPAQFTLTANPAGLRAGTYTGSVVLSGLFRVVEADGRSHDESSVTVPVRLVVTRQKRMILLSQTGFTFQAPAQGGIPLPDTLSLVNTGMGQMNWTAKTITLSGGSRWLQVSESQGTLSPYLDSKHLEVRVDQTGLAPGDYYGKVEIRADGADNSPQIATVLLQVFPAGSRLPPEIRPSALLFAGAQGSNPSAQRIRIANLSNQDATFSAGSTSQLPSFNYAPAKDIVPARARAEILVQPTTMDSLSTGVHKDHLNVVFSDSGPVRIDVVSVVAPDASVARNSSKEGRREANCATSKLDIVLTKLRANENATAGRAVPIEAQVFSNCGNRLTSSDRLTMSMGFSNGESTQSMSDQRTGVWTQTWSPKKSATKQVIMRVSALYAGPNLKFLADTTIVTFNMSDSDTPRINTKGIVNSASYSEGAPLAPGMRVSVYGESLSEQCRDANGNPLPTELFGTEVRLADLPIALDYVCAPQINAQLPFDLPTDTEHQLLIRRGVALSFPESFVIASAQPAVFSKDASGRGQASALHADGKFVEPGSPGKAGETISIYCTGLGIVDPPIGAGVAVTEFNYKTARPVQVEIDGKNADVRFAGLAPGLAGTYVVQAVIPQDARAGDAVPVVMRIDEKTSPVVTIAIQ